MRLRAPKPISVLSVTSIVALLAVGIGYLTFGVARVDWFTDYTHTTMTLTNSGGLAEHSPVLLTGVEVGEVTSITNIADGVEVRLRIDTAYRIPTASTVTIENLSALGEPYVHFRPTTSHGPFLRDGQQIDTRTVQMPLSIPDVARTVTDLMDQLHPEAIRSLIDTVNTGLAGLQDVVPTLSRSTNLLAATILSRTPAIRQLLIDLQAIGSDMAWTGPAMESAGPLWGKFGVRVSEVVDAIAKFAVIGNVPDDYITGNGVIPFLQKLTAYINEIGPDIQQLAPVIQPMAAAATAAIPAIDISDLVAQALNATSADGAVHLQIGVK
ncbi:MlaD family protein [Nocardia sp. NPDC051756]|uniref:MlaD family protein n=1 Tax=Nocardia sp. NPDC051756 TaxID=3154751 RepID=UPI003431432D